MSSVNENPCPHLDFAANLDVIRLQDEEGESGVTIAYTTNITVSCTGCGEPFVWMGQYAVGDLGDQPATSVDRRELRAPIRPAGISDEFGLNRPGFRMRLDIE